jgi:hypothetical protein
MAEALRVTSTLISLNFDDNSLGDGGGQAMAEALDVNITLSSLNIHHNSLGEGAGHAIAVRNPHTRESLYHAPLRSSGDFINSGFRNFS